MAGNEPVTSPDQQKQRPAQTRAARIGAVVVIFALLSMLFGNHRGYMENWFLIGLAGLLALILVGDWVLRKNGLRS
ncbi:MAG TPA: DUF2631 domain-containing protein [Micromonosporaceae bacterium]|nr:DUF2631 domain-containing protein [Micromonosporaceae bacterium]